MKKFYLYSVLSAFLLTCLSAFGQVDVLRTTIPFAFKVSDKLMPPGEYTVSETDVRMKMTHVKTNTSASHFTMPVSGPNTPPENSLRFTRYGSEYHLTSIWDPDSGKGEALVPSKHDKEIAKHFRDLDTSTIALQPRSN